jgi:GPH family glycoside/pentoside/hexuronide:cation symporter
LIDGMRQLAIIIAAIIIPMAFWWFFALREPGFAIAREQEKTKLSTALGATISNTTFLQLVAVIFTLAMGFNFVQVFSYYITIFYLYGGDAVAAGWLLGVTGTVWAITGLVAVFPLNWLSKRLGKTNTLRIAIVLMCAAQLSKIFCYNPDLPYLVLIPTVLLSAGMLMFFTLGASMVGDVCDEDELRTGTRSEGSFYAVYWWFIKVGSAIANFGMGALLVLTAFDERQNVSVDAIRGDITRIKVEAEKSQSQAVDTNLRLAAFDVEIAHLIDHADRLHNHFQRRLEERPAQAEHVRKLLDTSAGIRARAEALKARRETLVAAPSELIREADALLKQTESLKMQSPITLLRLWLFEIGIPLVLSAISLLLTARYPLTEARWREIRTALDQRHAAGAS